MTHRARHCLGVRIWMRWTTLLSPTPQLRHDIAAANELAPIALSDRQVARLLDFLHALTDPDSIDLRRDVPWSVPSGLPVFD